MESKIVKGKNEINHKEITALAKKNLIQASINILILIGISLLVNFCIRIDSLYFEHAIYELSVTELMQIFLLSATSCIFFLLAKKNNEVYYASILIAGFFCTLTLRELDHWFDMIFHGFWLYPALFISGLAISKALAGGWNTINGMGLISGYGSFKLHLAAVVLLLVFSRIYGMGDFWQAVMDSNYLREVKNISEEGIELLCYSLICFSSAMLYQDICHD